MKVDLDQPCSGDGFRLYTADPIDGGRIGPLRYEDHPFFHVCGGEPWIIPDDLDHGDVDGRKDIENHFLSGEDTHDGDQGAQDKYGIGTLQRQTD